jgi:hypothetical protein
VILLISEVTIVYLINYVILFDALKFTLYLVII